MRPKKMLMMTRQATLLAVLVALVTGCGTDSTSSSQREQQSLQAAPKVILIGVDGADWGVINNMAAQGELPGFARMMEEGAFGDLLNPGPQVSPVVWTTFATGHFSRDHGILDFVHPYIEVSGKQPVDVSRRRKPALWNLLDSLDRSSTVIGYFVSHPVEPIKGRMVSDRAFQNIDNAIWPAALVDLSDDVRRTVYADQEALYSRFIPWPYAPEQAEDESSPYHEAARIVEGRIDRHILADSYVRRMTERIIDDPADLLVSYYRITDIVSHSAWYYHDDSDWKEPADPETKALLGDLVNESYRYVDEVIKMMLERFAGQANIVVISDHGFGSATGAYATRNPLLTGNHRPNGVILAHGPDIRPGKLEPFTILDIFPTLANLLDAPIADTIPGSVNFQLLTESFLDRHPPRFVGSYDFGWQAVESQDMDQTAQAEEMESLRGLGYVGEGVTIGDRADDSGYNFWAASDELIASNLHAETVYHLIRGDAVAADEVVDAIQRNRPELLRPLLARTRAKIHALRHELNLGDELAPELKAFMIRHQQLSNTGEQAL